MYACAHVCMWVWACMCRCLCVLVACRHVSMSVSVCISVLSSNHRCKIWRLHKSALMKCSWDEVCCERNICCVSQRWRVQLWGNGQCWRWSSVVGDTSQIRLQRYSLVWMVSFCACMVKPEGKGLIAFPGVVPFALLYCTATARHTRVLYWFISSVNWKVNQVAMQRSSEQNTLR